MKFATQYEMISTNSGGVNRKSLFSLICCRGKIYGRKDEV
jgi:hypothetical protein